MDIWHGPGSWWATVTRSFRIEEGGQCKVPLTQRAQEIFLSRRCFARSTSLRRCGWCPQDRVANKRAARGCGWCPQSRDADQLRDYMHIVDAPCFGEVFMNAPWPSVKHCVRRTRYRTTSTRASKQACEQASLFLFPSSVRSSSDITAVDSSVFCRWWSTVIASEARDTPLKLVTWIELSDGVG